MSQGKLSLTVPVEKNVTGDAAAGTAIEVTNFDGETLAKPQPFSVKLTNPRHEFTVTVPVKIARADVPKTLVKLLAKTAAGDTTPLISVNLFEILRRLEVQILGQNEY